MGEGRPWGDQRIPRAPSEEAGSPGRAWGILALGAGREPLRPHAEAGTLVVPWLTFPHSPPWASWSWVVLVFNLLDLSQDPFQSTSSSSDP